MTKKEAVLKLLSDGRPHFSAEFRDTLGLLEYRKRLSELRDDGYDIRAIKLRQHVWDRVGRPAYQLFANSRPVDELGPKC